MLELSNLKKKYGLNPIIDIKHLVLPQGIHWLKGANGCGKTTLLKLLAGLLPFEGDVRLNNISSKKDAVTYRQLISWAEAEPLYPPFMSGSNLIRLYVDIRRASSAQASQLIDRLGMANYIHHKTGTYSAGMTKKLSLLLAFIGNPLLIILDEPLITLDADALQVVSSLVLEKSKEQGCSFLMSSHQNLQEEITVAGNIITLNNTSITTI